MKIVKYGVLGTLIGFVVGIVISIGIVGCDSTIDGTCSFLGRCWDGCLDYCGDGGFCSSTCGVAAGLACASVGCLNGCGDCSGDDSCVSGCIDGFKEGFDEFSPHHYACYACSNGCDACRYGLKTDVNRVYKQVSYSFKTKSYLVFLTIIGACIGVVFGVTVTAQEKRKLMQKIEKDRKEREHAAEEDRRRRKQAAEAKWKEMQDWLAN